MSLRVLVVPEDPTHNGAILAPLFRRMLAECGRPNAGVEVLAAPRVQGYEHAKRVVEESVIDRYGWCDLILFCPDRDGHPARDKELADLETRVGERAARPAKARLLCCAAVEEVEAWILAGHTQSLSRSWNDVRSDPSVKETEFERFLAKLGDTAAHDGGRAALMRETLGNYSGLKSRCPELASLEARVRAAIGDV